MDAVADEVTDALTRRCLKLEEENARLRNQVAELQKLVAELTDLSELWTR